jgi:hypothetical protein
VSVHDTADLDEDESRKDGYIFQLRVAINATYLLGSAPQRPYKMPGLVYPGRPGGGERGAALMPNAV